MKKKAAIYARVSTDRQEYQRQIKELQSFAERSNMEVKYVFEEKQSGFNSERPEYNKLMALTKEDIDIVLLWELSRLSRKSIEIQSDIEKLTSKGINVYIHNKSLYTLDEQGNINPTTKLIISIVATIAEDEVRTSKQRSKSARQQYIINEGRSYTSHAPYGYTLKNKKLFINEKEADLVRRVYQLCIDGYSIYGIAVLLNSEGLRTRANVLWTQATINSMFKNTVYIGKPKYCISSVRRTSKVFTRQYSRKVLEYVTLDRPELAIISEAIYDKAAEERKKRRHRSLAIDIEPYLLQHLFKCPDCNRYYTFDRTTKRQKYKCARKYDKTVEKPICQSPALERERVEFMIWESVKYYCIETMANTRKEEQQLPLLEEIDALKAKIENIDNMKQKIVKKAEIIVTAAIDLKIHYSNMPELYNKKMEEVDKLNKEAIKLDYERKRYKSQIENAKSQIDAINNVKDMSQYLKDVDFDTKYNLLHEVVDVILPYGTKDNCFLLEVRLKTGLKYYIGYYPTRAYYIQFLPSKGNYFVGEERSGYLEIINAKSCEHISLETEMKKYTIVEYINQMDIPANRYPALPYRLKKRDKFLKDMLQGYSKEQLLEMLQ